jgi:hypothetical protein
MADAMDIDEPERPIPRPMRTIPKPRPISLYLNQGSQPNGPVQHSGRHSSGGSASSSQAQLKPLKTSKSFDSREQQTQPQNPKSSQPATSTEALMAAIDLGDYDGGLEAENMFRGEIVHGEAAQSLALNSFHSR